jgi:hypothetical protein
MRALNKAGEIIVTGMENVAARRMSVKPPNARRLTEALNAPRRPTLSDAVKLTALTVGVPAVLSAPLVIYHGDGERDAPIPPC